MQSATWPLNDVAGGRARASSRLVAPGVYWKVLTFLPSRTFVNPKGCVKDTYLEKEHARVAFS